MKWWWSNTPEPVDPITDTPIFRAIDARLQRALKPGKRLLRIGAVILVLLVAVCIVLGYNVVQNRNNANGLKQDLIAGCQANNAQKAQLDDLLARQGMSSAKITEDAIKAFIDIAEGPHPTPQVLAIAKSIEDQIKDGSDKSLAAFKKELDKALVPRNCQAAYANVSGPVPTPGSET